MLPPAVTGLVGNYFGAQQTPISTTNRYYWVQALYPNGRSLLAGPLLVKAGVGLSNANVVSLSWNPAPGAISYDVLYTATNSLPMGNGAYAIAIGLTANNFTDVGNTPMNYTVHYSGDVHVAYAQLNFGVDGGAVGTITPQLSQTIPANAILVGGTINVTTAVTSAGSATVAVGTSAGSSTTSILGATAKSSLTVDALINAVPVFGTPVKMTAAGQITFTVAVAALTAGVIEAFVLYVVPSAA